MDILAKLLAPRKGREEEQPKGPVIEVVGGDESGLGEEEESEVEKQLVEEIGRLNLEQKEILEGVLNFATLFSLGLNSLLSRTERLAAPTIYTRVVSSAASDIHRKTLWVSGYVHRLFPAR